MPLVILSAPRVCYRLGDPRFALLDGSGAARAPGRWNAAGVSVVYAAGTFAGAILEQLAHAGIGRLPPREFISITIPAGVQITEESALGNPGWDYDDCRVSRALGHAWYKTGTTVALWVPSKPGAPVEETVVLNTTHRDFARLAASKPQPFAWDQRLHRANPATP